MSKTIIEKVLNDANKDKRIVKINARLKSNGRFASLNGQVYDIKTANDGHKYVVIENFNGNTRDDGRKWQNVAVESITVIKKDGFVYKQI